LGFSSAITAQAILLAATFDTVKQLTQQWSLSKRSRTIMSKLIISLLLLSVIL